jgi:hypothetical protein
MSYEINPLFVEWFGGVTVQRAEVTSCNFRAPIATLGALGNPREVLTHPNCTQMRVGTNLTGQLPGCS